MLKTRIFLNIPIDSLFSVTKKLFSEKQKNQKKKKKNCENFNICYKSKREGKKDLSSEFCPSFINILGHNEPNPPVHQ